MELTQDMKDLIVKQLNSEASSLILENFAELKELKKQIEQLQINFDKVSAKKDELRLQSDKWLSLQNDLEQFKKEKQDFEIEKAVLEEAKKHVDAAKQDMKDIVTTVFSNNKFKYNEFGNIPVAQDGGGGCMGMVNQYPSSKTVEGEQ